MTTQKEWLNPLDIMRRFWPNANLSHIEFDPNLVGRGDYWIVRGSTHDGTASFTIETLQRALFPLVSKTSFATRKAPLDWAEVAEIHYRVGRLRLATVFGNVMLPCSATHLYPGLRERVRIPVVFSYTTK